MCIFLYIQLLMFVFVIMCSKAKQRTKNIVFLVTTLLWGVVFGLRRNDVGNDSDMYRMFYTGYSIPGLGTYEINSETEEYGFTLVANILHRISPDVTFFYMAVSLAVFLLLYFVYKNKSTGYWGYLCFFVMSASFASLIIAMRQSMSIAFCLFAIYCFKHVDFDGHVKDMVKCFRDKYFITGLCSFLFSITVHRTSIMIMPVLILAYFCRYSRKIAYINVLVVLVLSILFSDQIGAFFDFALAIIGGFSDDNVSLLAERYKGDFGDSSMTLLKIASWCVPMFFTVKYISQEKLKSFEFTCLMIAFTIFILFGNATMCIRLSMLFQIIGFSVFIPDVVYKKKEVQYLYLGFTLLFFYSAYKTYSNWLGYSYDSTLPFYFFWE